ncbi:MAG: helix-turn-helix domain-containing protein [Terriglobales bacterium]
MESFGARLKREREQRKITLDEIAVSTKIGTRFLAAIEEDRFDQLPGGIFNKGFVRAYARHLGMDENQAIADFVAATEPVLPEPPQEAPVLAALAERVPEAKKKSRSDGGLPWGIFAIVLLALACGLAIWGFHSRQKPARPGIEVPGLQKPDSSALGDQKEAPRSEAKSALPDPIAATSQSPPPQPAPAAPESATSTAAATIPGADAGLFRVLIKARHDSWVAITADGKQIVQDTLAAPAEQSIEARDQIVIKTGNVGALEISFNGKKLASQGGYNQVKTLTFDPNGLRP